MEANNFIANCPLPVAPVHDSKDALRFRAICDERITLPLSALRASRRCTPSCWQGPVRQAWLPAPGSGKAEGQVLAGSDTTLRTQDQGTRRYPPITTSTVTAVNKHFPYRDEACVLGSVECGLVLPSICGGAQQGEVQDNGGLHVPLLQGLLEGSGTARSWSVVDQESGDNPVEAKDLFLTTPHVPLCKRRGPDNLARIHLLDVEALLGGGVCGA